MKTATLTPAYGKLYRTAKQALEDYHKGRDFILNDPTSPWNKKYCSVRNMGDYELVILRYGKSNAYAQVIHEEGADD